MSTPSPTAAKRTSASETSATERWLSAANADLARLTGPGSADALTPWRQMWALQEEAFRFGVRRAERYRRFFHDLRGCDTPMAAAKLCTEAAQTTVSDYVEEAQRVSASANGAATKAIQAANADPESA